MIKIVAGLIALAVIVLATQSAHAAYNPFAPVCNASNSTTNSSVCQPAQSGNPISGSGGIVIKVAAILATFTAVAAVIMIMIGGLKYIVSQGDPNAVSNAKNTILYAIIGLIISAMAGTIILVVIGKL